MPYLRSSLYIAASIALAEGDVNKLREVNPLVLDLIQDLYGQFLGTIDEGMLQQLFTQPWIILPRIQSMIEGLNNFRSALAEIEKAA